MRLREAVASFIMSREAKNCSNRTVQWYEVMLMKFQNYLRDNDTPFDKCTITSLRMYLRHLKKDKKYSDKYILGHFRVLKAFFNYLTLPPMSQSQRSVLASGFCWIRASPFGENPNHGEFESMVGLLVKVVVLDNKLVVPNH